ncbi:phosphatase PAP2 family protein [Aquabacterium sp.]|uniref:vanadium-dependent haloperoxidase n=1 Tax=Aquabacterium sp. TaxID=1872578 RepID=UPI003D6D881C
MSKIENRARENSPSMPEEVHERGEGLKSWVASCLLPATLLLTPTSCLWAANPVDGVGEAYGAQFDAADGVQAPASRVPRPSKDTAQRLLYWNEVAINASGLDHTPVAPGDQRVFGEQIGPARSSRAMAIVHIAMFDAANAVSGKYTSYSPGVTQQGNTSVDAAVAQAAHDTLIAMYPSQKLAFDKALTDDLAKLDNNLARQRGIELGRRSAAAILATRANDGSDFKEPVVGVDFTPSNQPGKWRPDPVSQIPLALGLHWGKVKPFASEAIRSYRLPPPPSMKSAEYTVAFNELKRLGGDGVSTPTIRTEDQGVAGRYWAYDGMPSLCAPPRLYNQVAVHIAKQQGTANSYIDLARLLVLVNVTMADAGTAAWDNKWYYQHWRPVTGLREADPGTGPTGLGDGNPATRGDPDFMPLGAPADNIKGPNFSPPFPSYPSGHATIGGALFETLRQFYGTDNIAFSFVSDEYNGLTVDNTGNIRPLEVRSFSTLSQAEEENGQSRIYLGIHWAFDKTQGISLGRRISRYVFRHAFLRAD